MPRPTADYTAPKRPPIQVDRSKPAAPQIYQELRRRIVHLELPPGEAISEAEIASAAGISRTPIRQALQRLVDENLLVTYPSMGTFVQRLDSHQIHDALLLRCAVEPGIAAACARLPDRAPLIKTLRKLLAEHEQALEAGDAYEANAVDHRFHQALCQAASRPLSWAAIRMARAQGDRVHALTQGMADSLMAALSHHREIVDAIEAGDADAAAARMTSHMRLNETNLENVRRDHAGYFADHSDANP